MNKFVLIPYDQYYSFKSYLMEKNHGISSDKAEREVIADSDDADKHEMNDKVNISIKSETETLNKNDLSGDILDKKKDKNEDNVNDNQSVDRLLPPPGIPVKTKKTKKIFQYGIRDGQEGGGTKTEPKWVKKWQRKIS